LTTEKIDFEITVIQGGKDVGFDKSYYVTANAKQREVLRDLNSRESSQVSRSTFTHK